MCTTVGYYKANEEVFGVKVLDPENSLMPTFLQPFESSAPSKSSLPQKSPDDSYRTITVANYERNWYGIKTQSKHGGISMIYVELNAWIFCMRLRGRCTVPSGGEAKEKAVEEVFEKMEAVEKGMRELFPDGAPIIDGKNLGFLDIVMITTLMKKRLVSKFWIQRSIH
ncbi:hypothetical protein Patl1_17784 [Pistacia atlantica]|uniref:Uncharacterized protein n=1 Tax=Pistacia atlantica TaxID=434234 RepID=A0ACC1BZ08_9ROSI|nr:hypothetical protein Patl1_17784 [Pistacia atlantica]